MKEKAINQIVIILNMLLLGFFLLPVIVTGYRETVNDYSVEIIGGILRKVEPIGEPRSELNLSGRGLRIIGSGAFDNLGNLTSLFLANNSLTRLPPEDELDKLKRVMYLSLANNSIENTWRNSSGLDNLEVFDLSDNPLTGLTRTSLYGRGHCAFRVDNTPLKIISDTAFDQSPSKITSELTVPILINSWTQCYTNNPFTHVEDVPSLAELLAEEVVGCPRVERRRVNTDDFVVPANTRVEICLHNGTLPKVSILLNGTALTENCGAIPIETDTDFGSKLNLGYMNIKNLSDKWYHLENVRLHTIDLAYNKITHLSSNVLNDLPESVKYVRLVGNKIERLESGTIKNKFLLYLDLTFNGLREIADNALNETNLSVLYLRGNYLRDTRFIRNLPSSLTELNLRHNKIAEISPGLFSHLNKLQEVDLSQNKITELGNQALQGLSSLQQLDLSNNGLRRIEPGAFRDLGELRTLDLSENKISELNVGVFSGLRKLFSLQMMKNHLTKITNETFQDIPATLMILDLSKNRIRRLDEGSFVKVPKYCLFLNGNNIFEVKKEYFDLPYLHVLDFNDNEIVDIKRENFDFPKLRELNLGINAIRHIREGAFKKLGNLTNMVLSNNPLKTIRSGSLVGMSTSMNSYVHVSNMPLFIVDSPFYNGDKNWI